MENTLREIKERHEREIQKFIDSCPHPKISEPISYMWAPGHFSDKKVRICERCNKIISNEYAKMDNALAEKDGVIAALRADLEAANRD